MKDFKVDEIISCLWNWVTTFKDRELIKDTSKICTSKFDCYINSSASDPLSMTVFELSDQGEIIINDVTRLMESKAAYYVFVNTKTGWIIAVKNTIENQKKLIKGEKIQSHKIRIIN